MGKEKQMVAKYERALSYAARDFDRVNDELARLKRENEELKKNQATHINHVVGN